MRDAIHLLRSIAAALLLLQLVSCGDLAVGSDPENTAAGNFEVLWGELDRYYALFDVKGIDWDSLHEVYRARITPATSERELFDIVHAMLLNLNDAHVSVRAPFGSFYADTSFDDTSALLDRELILARYLHGAFDTTGEGRIYYGMMEDGIGYILIPSFAGPIDIAPGLSRWAQDIDRVMAQLKDAKGMVIDIRGNDGGNTFNAAYIAGRFADSTRLYQMSYSRRGPEHDYFIGPFLRYVEPGGGGRFTRPIALLTNGRSISGAEWFTMAMRQFPYVTVIGDTTAGNLSGRMDRELPNGWNYSISVQKVLSPDGKSYEGIGIPPDVPMQTRREDLMLGRDPILDAALMLLRR